MTSQLDNALSFFSDAYKDLHGSRPRGLWVEEMTLEAVLAETDLICDRLNAIFEQEIEDADPDSWKKYAHMGIA